MRLRSIVSIPAGSPIDAALDSAADAIAVSLADAGHDVENLRAGALYALPKIREVGKRAIVIVNHPRTQLLRADLEQVVTSELSAVLLAHTVEPQDVRDLAVLLREFEYNRGIEPGTVQVFPVVDSARGLLRATELVHAVPRVAGLVLSSRGYAEDIGARHEERGERLAYARGAVVAAARAYDTLPIIDSSGLELTYLAEYGFAGALIDDPRHVAGANAAFTPNQGAKERARQQLAAYEARGERAWVGRYANTVVDAHRARKAAQLIEE